MKYLHEELTSKIVNCFFRVYNNLGYGFLEKIYENCLIIELEKQGLRCQPQTSIIVIYENQEVGKYYADIVVEEKVIIELKSVDLLHPTHECQIMNYLKATSYEVGLLLNFGLKATIKRKILTNDLKPFKNHRPNQP